MDKPGFFSEAIDTQTRSRAKRRANETQQAHGIYRHVGSYGRPTGDVPATHEVMVRSFAASDPPEWWALIECVDPDGV